MEYLAALNQTSAEETRRNFAASTTISWQGPEDFSRHVEETLAWQAAAIQGFVAKARERGLGDLSGMPMTIVSEVDDLREGVAAALPGIAPSEFRLR
jgi:hypothetical protein